MLLFVARPVSIFLLGRITVTASILIFKSLYNFRASAKHLKVEVAVDSRVEILVCALG